MPMMNKDSALPFFACVLLFLFIQPRVVSSSTSDGDDLAQDPSEAKNRLARLFDKIDTSGDGEIEKNELVAWVELAFRRADKKKAAKFLRRLDRNRDGLASLDEYLIDTFGYQLKEIEAMESDPTVDAKNFLESIEEEKSRFQRADENDDGHLDSRELAAFSAPFNYPHMVEYAVAETMRYHDVDGDGQLSMKEYLGETADSGVMAYEKEQFKSIDKDRNGFIDFDELKNHIKEESNKYAVMESNRLLLESDLNGDDMVTRGEMAEAYRVWLASQATNNGELLSDDHLARPAPHWSMKDEL